MVSTLPSKGHRMTLPTTPWDRRVQFRIRPGSAPFAYRPNQVITTRDALPSIARRLGKVVDDLDVETILTSRPDDPVGGPPDDTASKTAAAPSEHDTDTSDAATAAAVAARDEAARAEKQDETLHREQRKVLTSLQNHWDGLTVFVDHPEVSMDNNAGERSLRGPVCGRKNYWGSGSIWSASFAAMMFSLFQTLGLWDINRDHWLSAYLNACANNGGKAPGDLAPFLPREMDRQRRRVLSLPLSTGPPDIDDTS